MKRLTTGDDLQAKTEGKKKKKKMRRCKLNGGEWRTGEDGMGERRSGGGQGEKKKNIIKKKGKGNDNDERTRAAGGEGRWGGNDGMVIILHGGNKGGKIERMEGEGWRKGGNPAW
jgi:hypothetical protein